jgi:hypothetical protein
LIPGNNSVLRQTNRSSKTKLDTSNLGIKSKRLRKLTDQLPDIGGVEGLIIRIWFNCLDILKLQEELTESQSKIKTLEDENAQLLAQLHEKEKGINVR